MDGPRKSLVATPLFPLRALWGPFLSAGFLTGDEGARCHVASALCAGTDLLSPPAELLLGLGKAWIDSQVSNFPRQQEAGASLAELRAAGLGKSCGFVRGFPQPPGPRTWVSRCVIIRRHPFCQFPKSAGWERGCILMLFLKRRERGVFNKSLNLLGPYFLVCNKKAFTASPS